MSEYGIVPVQGDPFASMSIVPSQGDPFVSQRQNAIDYADSLPEMAAAQEKALSSIPAMRSLNAERVGWQDAYKTFVEPVLSAVTAPGDIMAGKLTPDDPRFAASAIGAAGLLTGRGLASPGEGVGIFGGRLAATADHAALDAAQKLEAAGQTRADILQQTGWFRGTDNQWRFEIPDQGAALKGQAGDKHGAPTAVAGTAPDVIDHPELFAAYPALRDTTASVREVPAQRGGTAYGDMFANAPTKEQARSVMLHELQHGVQDIEGFAPGGSPESPQVLAMAMQDGLVGADPYGIYRRLAGEVEARNVQTRANWSPEDRVWPPWRSEDTPADQQITIVPVAGDPFSGAKNGP